MTAQPNTIDAKRGNTWTIPVRVTNTQASTAALFVVARIKLPSGAYYPSTGWFWGPTAISVAAGQTASTTMSVALPISAPLISAKMEFYVGTPAAGAMDFDSFDFSIIP